MQPRIVSCEGATDFLEIILENYREIPLASYTSGKPKFQEDRIPNIPSDQEQRRIAAEFSLSGPLVTLDRKPDIGGPPSFCTSCQHKSKADRTQNRPSRSWIQEPIRTEQSRIKSNRSFFAS